MFLLGATTRGYLRTAHRIAIRNVHLCPPHVLRNRAGESALDAVFEVGDTNAGQSEPEDWTCPYSRLARHTGEFTGLHAIKRSKDDAKVRHISNESCNADQFDVSKGPTRANARAMEPTASSFVRRNQPRS